MKKVILMLLVLFTLGSASAQEDIEQHPRSNSSDPTITALELSELQKMQLQDIQNQYVLALVEAVHEDYSLATKKYLKECWEKRNSAIRAVLTEAQFLDFIRKEVKPIFLIELEQLEEDAAWPLD